MMVDDAYVPADAHAEEDENYFISMTDMMVGVLFVFIILLMVFAFNFRQQTDRSEEDIQRLKAVAATAEQVARELEKLQERVNDEIGSMNAADSVRRELLREIAASLSAQGIEVTVDELNGVLRLRDDAIGFRTNEATLEGKAAGNVARVAAVLAEVVPKYTEGAGDRAAYIETIFIEGHTDRRGSDQRNFTLSTERAVNTYFEMLRSQASLKGLHNRSDKEVLSVSGYGSSRPVPGIGIDAYDAHRRIDLRFVMDVDNQKRLEEVRRLAEAMNLELGKLDKAVQDAVDSKPAVSDDVR